MWMCGTNRRRDRFAGCILLGASVGGLIALVGPTQALAQIERRSLAPIPTTPAVPSAQTGQSSTSSPSSSGYQAPQSGMPTPLYPPQQNSQGEPQGDQYGAGGQNYQGGQGYQSGQSYPSGQGYQTGQSSQGYPPDQGYPSTQGPRPDQADQGTQEQGQKRGWFRRLFGRKPATKQSDYAAPRSQDSYSQSDSNAPVPPAPIYPQSGYQQQQPVVQPQPSYQSQPNAGQPAYQPQPNYRQPADQPSYGAEAQPPGQSAPAYGQQPSYGAEAQPPVQSGPAYGQQPHYGGGPNYGAQQAVDGNGPALGAQASYGMPAQDSTPLPPGIWNGVDNAAMAKLIADVRLPSRSPVLAALTARALAADPPADGQGIAIRVAALEKAGQAPAIVTLLQQSAQAGDPGAEARYALALFAVGRDDEACRLQLGGLPQGANPNSDAGRAALLIPVYCAAAHGNKQAAVGDLAAALARGLAAPVAEAVIGQLAGKAERVPVPRQLDVLDYIFLRLGHVAMAPQLADAASPVLLYLLAHDKGAPPELRLEAAERAAALNIIDGDDLRSAYLQAGAMLGKSTKLPAALRAKLFATFEAAPSAKYRAESIEALLASGREIGIAIPLAKALSSENAKLVNAPQVADFAETGIQVAILAGDEQSAWKWIARGGPAARNWSLLVAAADPSNPRSNQVLQQGAAIASQTRLPTPVLNRLITVLDALNYNVPFALWDMADQTQPDDGYLPPTGVLTELKRASDAHEVGRTILLVAAALGPDGPKGAHVLALGDAVRALRKVGLDIEARRLGFEALYARWPVHGKA